MDSMAGHPVRRYIKSEKRARHFAPQRSPCSNLMPTKGYMHRSSRHGPTARHVCSFEGGLRKISRAMQGYEHCSDLCYRDAQAQHAEPQPRSAGSRFLTPPGPGGLACHRLHIMDRHQTPCPRRSRGRVRRTLQTTPPCRSLGEEAPSVSWGCLDRPACCANTTRL